MTFLNRYDKIVISLLGESQLSNIVVKSSFFYCKTLLLEHFVISKSMLTKHLALFSLNAFTAL